MGLVSRWIDAQDDEVLGRIAGAESMRPRMNDCLLFHAFGPAPGSIGAWDHDIAKRFDFLCFRFGDARIGHLISERARRVLAGRRKVERVVTIYDSIRVPRTDEFLVTRSSVSLNCEPVEVGT